MRLGTDEGAGLTLQVVGYQFPDAPVGTEDEWDCNWLVVHGEVRTAAGDSWPFQDPCLTTFEARELDDWLRAAAQGRVPPAVVADDDSPGALRFVEPNLAFSLDAVDDQEVVVRVHLSAEALGPPPLGPDPWPPCSIAVRAPRGDLTEGRDACPT